MADAVATQGVTILEVVPSLALEYLPAFEGGCPLGQACHGGRQRHHKGAVSPQHVRALVVAAPRATAPGRLTPPPYPTLQPRAPA